MLLQALSGNVCLIVMMLGLMYGGPMRSMGGAQPGAERL